MGGKRHDIWSHFRVVKPAVKGEKQHPDVECKYCGQTIRNAQRKKNLAEHLSNPKKCGKAPQDIVRVFGTRSPANSRARRHAGGGLSVPGQASDSFVSQEELELDFAELFYATEISFRIVEDPAVKRFFGKACPSFRLPSRQRIAGPLLEATYKKRKEDVVEQLKQQQYLALSTDGWSDANNTSIVNFMLVSPTMKPVFWSSVATGEEEHIGVYIADCIDRVIEEVETAIGRKGAICAVVTDNARNMKAAWKEVQRKRPYVYCNGCAAYAFNLLMKDDMKISRLADVRDDSKSVAKFVRARHGLLDRYRSQQNDILKKGERRMALSVPIPTRWYTVEKCIRSVSRNESVIRSTFADTQLLKRYNTKTQRPEADRVAAIVADDERWAEAKRTLDLLTPINKSLAVCESDNTYLSSVYSEFVALNESTAYSAPVDRVSMEERAKYAEIQCEILDLIGSRRDFIMPSSMRVAYLLDQTADIKKFSNANDPRGEGDVSHA